MNKKRKNLELAKGVPVAPVLWLGPPARCPFSPVSFLGEGSPTKIDYRKKSVILFPTSLLEDLDGHNDHGPQVD